MAVSYRKQKLHFFSWRVVFLLLLASNSNPLCFSAHSGSNLLPEPGVILDAGSLVAMVVKEVAVISAPLFGGLMAIVQLVSVTAGVTQKRYVPYAVAKRNTNVNYPCWYFEMYFTSYNTYQNRYHLEGLLVFCRLVHVMLNLYSLCIATEFNVHYWYSQEFYKHFWYSKQQSKKKKKNKRKELTDCQA